VDQIQPRQGLQHHERGPEKKNEKAAKSTGIHRANYKGVEQKKITPKNEGTKKGGKKSDGISPRMEKLREKSVTGWKEIGKIYIGTRLVEAGGRNF